VTASVYRDRQEAAPFPDGAQSFALANLNSYVKPSVLHFVWQFLDNGPHYYQNAGPMSRQKSRVKGAGIRA
jgi:hypothetical protein